MLESTNVSSKNAFVKKQSTKNEKIHRRYGSAEIYKSPQNLEKKKMKRKNSMESIKYTSHSKMEEKKEPKVKQYRKKEKIKWEDLKVKGTEVKT